MAGSLRVLWPWPDGLDSTALAAPGGDVEIATMLAAIAFIVVIALGRLGRRGRRSPQTEVRAGK